MLELIVTSPAMAAASHHADSRCAIAPGGLLHDFRLASQKADATPLLRAYGQWLGEMGAAVSCGTAELRTWGMLSQCVARVCRELRYTPAQLVRERNGWWREGFLYHVARASLASVRAFTGDADAADDGELRSLLVACEHASRPRLDAWAPPPDSSRPGFQ